jgi:hypothetical protein
VSDETEEPRQKTSGIYAARTVEDLRFSAVLCVGERDDGLVDAVRDKLPDPGQLVVVRSELELHEAQRDMSAASFFGLGTGTSPDVHALKMLQCVRAAWPSTPRLWFDRQAIPALPSPVPPDLLGVQLWERPYYEDRSALVDRLVVECEKGLAERMAQVASARAFAEHYGLPPKAMMLCIAIALRIPEARWAPFVEQNSDQLTRYLSRSVYGRLGLRSRPDLVRELLDFQQQWLPDPVPEPLTGT